MKGNVYIMKMQNMLKKYIEANGKEPTKILLSYRYFRGLMQEIYEGIPLRESKYLLGLPIVVKPREKIPDKKDIHLE